MFCMAAHAAAPITQQPSTVMCTPSTVAQLAATVGSSAEARPDHESATVIQSLGLCIRLIPSRTATCSAFKEPVRSPRGVSFRRTTRIPAATRAEQIAATLANDPSAV